MGHRGCCAEYSEERKDRNRKTSQEATAGQ